MFVNKVLFGVISVFDMVVGVCIVDGYVFFVVVFG